MKRKWLERSDKSVDQISKPNSLINNDPQTILVYFIGGNIVYHRNKKKTEL